ncbi:hypothetical protein T440DRAFT_484055 [Plenodomus tracheiphilus IPT5]|uniref:Myb-like domain-containing protein n=1 Tax=Plenodomus tracheiphilus IPT5 TaxID=1408161 RepID=A0A6A7AN26_9PLEO|nr:hypothetical protein T440DRAFT_484055 [Plenodomus tracheiphilus IPT5]
MPAYSAHHPASTASIQGGPVLPAIAELRLPFHSRTPVSDAIQPGLPKRAASQASLPEESPAKKESKWAPEEDNLTIELRGQGMKWDDIAKRLQGRSSISCRLRYQNYLQKRVVWNEEKKNRLARLCARFKDQMWQKVATDGNSMAFSRVHAFAAWRTGDGHARERSSFSMASVGYF